MNRKIKKLWVEALRSGKFKQGKGALCKIENGTPSYCCLGVLCELAVREGVVTAMEDADRRRYDYGNYVLPEKVVNWAELDRCDPFLSLHGSAADHNDRGDSFEEIAGLIETGL